MLSKKRISAIVSLIVVIATLPGTAQARSVYAITKHLEDELTAYDIQDDQIDYQATGDVTGNANGAVGLALDPDSGVMFVTYEGDNIIEMVNAKTLAPLGKSKTVIDAANLAGIVFDQTKQKTTKRVIFLFNSRRLSAIIKNWSD